MWVQYYCTIQRKQICCLSSTEAHVNWLLSAAFHLLLMWEQTNTWSYAILIINFGKSIVPGVIVKWSCIIYPRETVLEHCSCLKLNRLICNEVCWTRRVKPGWVIHLKWKQIWKIEQLKKVVENYCAFLIQATLIIYVLITC